MKRFACFLKINIFLLISSLAFCSCETKEAKREYTEIVIEPATGPFVDSFKTRDTPVTDISLNESGIKLSWSLPVDWVERERRGMRLAAFSSGMGKGAIECTVISLPGQAGGLESNVKRWIGQINLEIPSEETLKTFVNSSEKFNTAGGLSATLIDLTKLTQSKTAQSMNACAIDTSQETIFVKMTGLKSALEKNREKLKSLCQSLKIKNQ